MVKNFLGLPNLLLIIYNIKKNRFFLAHKTRPPGRARWKIHTEIREHVREVKVRHHKT